MRIAALISAPKGGADFPDKLLSIVNGKSVIEHTIASADATGIFTDIVVVTNDDDIEAKLGEAVKVVKTKKSFENYIERLAEVSVLTDADMFVCIPADHLRVHTATLEKLLQLFEGAAGKDVQVASVVQKIQKDAEQVKADKNTVKVVLGLRMHALYFSRYAIPYMQHDEAGFACYEHINIMACKKDAMFNFIQWPPSPLERAEQIHALRFVENGVQIKMLIAQYPYIKMKTAADLPAAEAFLKAL
jgi:3-deoxy-manno-octulosonate cytidylyltransferase (CMP-KDO synthetase)